jgi:flagellar biogenesis protein FliO
MVDWGALLKWVGISVGVGLAIIIVVVILLCYFVYKRMTGASFKGETGVKNRPSPEYSCRGRGAI